MKNIKKRLGIFLRTVMFLSCLLVTSHTTTAMKESQDRPIDNVLLEAVKEDNFNQVKDLLTRGANPSFSKEEHVELSGEEYKQAYERIPKTLQRAEDFLGKPEIGKTIKLSPLHVAAANLNPEITKLLLSKKAQVNPSTELEETPLLSTLIALHKKPSSFSQAFNITKMLLEHGANPNVISYLENRRTPLQLVVDNSDLSQNQKKQLVDLLLLYGADPSIPFQPQSENQPSFFSRIINIFKKSGNTLYAYYPLIKESYDAYITKLELSREIRRAYITLLLQSKRLDKDIIYHILRYLSKNDLTALNQQEFDDPYVKLAIEKLKEKPNLRTQEEAFKKLAPKLMPK